MCAAAPTFSPQHPLSPHPRSHRDAHPYYLIHTPPSRLLCRYSRSVACIRCGGQIHFAINRIDGQHNLYPRVVIECRPSSTSWNVRSYDTVLDSWLPITTFVVMVIAACYVVRLLYTSATFAKQASRFYAASHAVDDARPTRERFVTYYAIDLILACALLAMVVVELMAAVRMADYFAEYKEAVLDAQGLGVQEQYRNTSSALSAVFEQRDTSGSACQHEQILCTPQDLEIALQGLDAARFAATLWPGAKYKLSDVDFRVTSLSFSNTTTLSSFPVELIHAKRAVSSIAFFVALLKSLLRCMRDFTPFRARCALASTYCAPPTALGRRQGSLAWLST